MSWRLYCPWLLTNYIANVASPPFVVERPEFYNASLQCNGIFINRAFCIGVPAIGGVSNGKTRELYIRIIFAIL